MTQKVNSKITKLKSQKFEQRGKKTNEQREKEKEQSQMVSPFVLGLLLFVVVGSVLIQIINNARNAATYGSQAQYEG